jgi:predicted phage-related endonuclease
VSEAERPAWEDTEAAEHALLQEEKKASIGGTDAATVSLESAGKKGPFGKSALDIWLRLTGRAPAPVDSDRFEMGRLMEDPIATRFQRRTGLVTRKLAQQVHPQYPWATGHIDRGVLDLSPVAESVDGDLEIKAPEFDPLNEWSDPALGEEQRVPLPYFLQVVWYVGLPRDSGAAFERMIYLAAQMGFSSPLRIYRWWPDEKIRQIHARMFEASQRFWEENVLKDDPPPMSVADPEAARRWLAFKHPSAKDQEIVGADPSFLEIAKAFDEAREKAKHWDGEKDRLGAEIGRLVGDHYGLMANVGGEIAKATWPTIQATTEAVTDWEGVLLDLGVTVPAEAIQNRTRIVEKRKSYRRLTVSVKKGK